MSQILLLLISGLFLAILDPGSPVAEGPMMVSVAGGTFFMGDETDWAEDDERPAHIVTLPDFEIGKYEITRKEFREFCKDTGRQPAFPEGGDSLPATGVQWQDAIEFCNWLSRQRHFTPAYRMGSTISHVPGANGFRLPTEAEWEFAARGGTKTEDCLYAGSDFPAEVGWFTGNSGKEVHPMGSLKPNEIGLYDMTGNVWEWCGDFYDQNYYADSPKNSPQGPKSGLYHVLRGGNCESLADYCRNTNRYYQQEISTAPIGFRVARSK